MVFLQLNAKGIRSKLDYFKLFIKNHSPEAFVVQETKLKPQQSFSLPGYDSFMKSIDTDGTAHGGVAIFVKSSLNPQEIRISVDIGDIQAVAVRLMLPRPITLCSVYMQATDDVQEMHLLNLISCLGSDFVIMGDFNAHHPLWGHDGHDRLGKVLFDMIDAERFLLLNEDGPTYIDDRNGTQSTLDLALCSPGLSKFFTWEVADDFFPSDHLPILIGWGQGRRFTFPQITRFNCEKANWPSFVDLTNVDPVVPIVGAQSALYQYDCLMEVILHAANESIPKYQPGTYRYNVPWWTSEIGETLKKRKRLYKKFKRNPDVTNFSNLKICSEELKRMIEEAKTKSWREFTTSFNKFTTSKDLWVKFNALRGKKSKTEIEFLENNGKTISNPSQIANVLAYHIQQDSSSNKYSIGFQQVISNHVVNGFEIPESTDCINSNFSLYELEFSINAAKGNSAGPDYFTYSMLKNLHTNAKRRLLNVFNGLFNFHVIPDSWRQSIIVPILKPGKSSRLKESYRPIALTSVVSKTFERMAKKRLQFELESRLLLPQNQFAFRRDRSTIDVGLKIEDQIVQGFCASNPEHTLIALFDIKSAYNRVWSGNVVLKLIEMGFGGNIVHFIANFLTERKFLLINGKGISNIFNLQNGLPQGSVISVICFLIAATDLEDFIMKEFNKKFQDQVKISINTFADDLSIAITGPVSQARTEEALEFAIQLAIQWFEKHGFEVCTPKTVILHCCRSPRSCHSSSIVVNGQTLELKDSARILGFIFDQKLTWKQHMEHRKKQAFKTLNFLKMVSHFKWGGTRDTLLSIHKAATLGSLEYGCELYSGASKTLLKKLDVTHNTGVRLALGAFKSSPIDSLMVEANLPSLALRREEKILALGARILQKKPDMHHILENPRGTERSRNSNFAMRFRQLARDFITDIDALKLAESYANICPHSRTYERIHLHLHETKKENLPPAAHLQNALEFFDGFDEIVFTDGSKNESSVGFSVVFDEHQHATRVSKDASVFTAEAMAILKALKFMEGINNKDKRWLIASDSLSCLEAARNFDAKDQIIREIQAKLEALTNVHLGWVPSHVGISGNEMADKLAKEGALRPQIDENFLSLNDFRRLNKIRTFDRRRELWENVPDTNKMKQWKTDLSARGQFNPNTRREQTILTRLRIGHSRLTHGYLMDKDTREANQNPCPYCGEKLSIVHILRDCTNLQHLQPWRPEESLQSIFEQTPARCERLLKYVEQIGLLHEI